MPWKTITRQELYDEVWSQAVCKLAPKYNLSDVGFAKSCKRFDIPRPPRGYWAKLEAGKKVSKTPLPQLDEEPEIRVHQPGPEETQSNEEAKTEVEKMTEGLSLIDVAAIPILRTEVHGAIGSLWILRCRKCFGIG